jgi:glycosyltransferase involved in cell wall biosynthesis
MRIELSVAICTHNPRYDYLERVVNGLRGQSLHQDRWEFLIVDNCSFPGIDKSLVSWHKHGRVSREAELGLTHARLRGIKETVGEIIVFVDDDNVLQTNYLEVALAIANQQSHIGAWSGQCHAEYEHPPAPWFYRYQGMLVIREFARDVWSNLGHLPDTMPCGAGMCVRRPVAQVYADLHNSGKRPMLLDRQGTSLISAGDNDLSACACDIGLGVGLFHKLELTHLISAGRTTEEYLVRLAEGIYYSAIYLKAFRGIPTPMKSSARKLLELAQVWRMSAHDRRIFQACCRGESRALQELARNPISSGPNPQANR